jgi:hypothetical protein
MVGESLPRHLPLLFFTAHFYSSPKIPRNAYRMSNQITSNFITTSTSAPLCQKVVEFRCYKKTSENGFRRWGPRPSHHIFRFTFFSMVVNYTVFFLLECCVRILGKALDESYSRSLEIVSLVCK